MKQKLLLIAIGLLVTMVTFAQQQQGQRGQSSPEDRVKKQTEKMVKDLGLNEEQSAEVTKINEKYGKMRAELFAGEPADRQQRWEKMKEMIDLQNAEYKKVLTEEQYKKHIEMLEQRREEMQKRRTERQDAPQRGQQRGQQRGTK